MLSRVRDWRRISLSRERNTLVRLELVEQCCEGLLGVCLVHSSSAAIVFVRILVVRLWIRLFLELTFSLEIQFFVDFQKHWLWIGAWVVGNLNCWDRRVDFLGVRVFERKVTFRFYRSLSNLQRSEALVFKIQISGLLNLFLWRHDFSGFNCLVVNGVRVFEIKFSRRQRVNILHFWALSLLSGVLVLFNHGALRQSQIRVLLRELGLDVVATPLQAILNVGLKLLEDWFFTRGQLDLGVLVSLLEMVDFRVWAALFSTIWADFVPWEERIAVFYVLRVDLTGVFVSVELPCERRIDISGVLIIVWIFVCGDWGVGRQERVVIQLLVERAHFRLRGCDSWQHGVLYESLLIELHLLVIVSWPLSVFARREYFHEIFYFLRVLIVVERKMLFDWLCDCWVTMFLYRVWGRRRQLGLHHNCVRVDIIFRSTV